MQVRYNKLLIQTWLSRGKLIYLNFILRSGEQLHLVKRCAVIKDTFSTLTFYSYQLHKNLFVYFYPIRYLLDTHSDPDIGTTLKGS